MGDKNKMLRARAECIKLRGNARVDGTEEARQGNRRRGSGGETVHYRRPRNRCVRLLWGASAMQSACERKGRASGKSGVRVITYLTYPPPRGKARKGASGGAGGDFGRRREARQEEIRESEPWPTLTRRDRRNVRASLDAYTRTIFHFVALVVRKLDTRKSEEDDVRRFARPDVRIKRIRRV